MKTSEPPLRYTRITLLLRNYGSALKVFSNTITLLLQMYYVNVIKCPG